MFRGVISVCDRIARPFGSLMRDPRANKIFPAADAAIAFAFAQRRDGLVNLPTRSIIETAVRLRQETLTQRLIFFGSSHENNMTEAAAMAAKAREMGVEDEFISAVSKPIEISGSYDLKQQLADKYLDMVLLGQELARLDIKSSYLVAHPLHLWRARLLCEKSFPGVTFYPVEAERIYDWESNQSRCRAEIFFIPWNLAAFAEHLVRGKI